MRTEKMRFEKNINWEESFGSEEIKDENLTLVQDEFGRIVSWDKRFIDKDDSGKIYLRVWTYDEVKKYRESELI